MAPRLEATASRLEASNVEAMSYNLIAMACNLRAMASNLIAMATASRLETIAIRLEAVASTLETTAIRLEAIASSHLGSGLPARSVAPRRWWSACGRCTSWVLSWPWMSGFLLPLQGMFCRPMVCGEMLEVGFASGLLCWLITWP